MKWRTNAPYRGFFRDQNGILYVRFARWVPGWLRLPVQPVRLP